MLETKSFRNQKSHTRAYLSFLSFHFVSYKTQIIPGKIE